MINQVTSRHHIRKDNIYAIQALNEIPWEVLKCSFYLHYGLLSADRNTRYWPQNSFHRSLVHLQCLLLWYTQHLPAFSATCTTPHHNIIAENIVKIKPWWKCLRSTVQCYSSDKMLVYNETCLNSFRYITENNKIIKFRNYVWKATITANSLQAIHKYN